MSEDDLKSVIAKYQQKAFELYNANIVLETQIEKLNLTIQSLSNELEKLGRAKTETNEKKEFI